MVATIQYFYIKQGDTWPYLRVTLKDGNGAAINVLGCTITFTMRQSEFVPAKVSAQPVTIVDGANGIVEYRWGDTDTDQAGTFDGEFRVIFTSLEITTIPTEDYLRVVVVPKL